MARRFESEFHIWTRRLFLTPDGKKTNFCEKLCNSERIPKWEQIVKHVHPVCEIEHIKRNIILKKGSQCMTLRKNCEELEGTICIKEHDLEQTKQILRIPNFEMKSMKQRTEDLGMQTALLCCKARDLENKAIMYEELDPITSYLNEPVHFKSGGKQMELACQSAVNEFLTHIHEFHSLHKTCECLDILNAKIQSVVDFIRFHTRELSLAMVEHTVFNLLHKLNGEWFAIRQACKENKEQQLRIVEELLRPEIDKFLQMHFVKLLIAHLELRKTHTQVTAEYNMLLHKIVQISQENYSPLKYSEEEGDVTEIKKMLNIENQILESDYVKALLEKEIERTRRKASGYHCNSTQEGKEETELQIIISKSEKLMSDIHADHLHYQNPCLYQVHEKLKMEYAEYHETEKSVYFAELLKEMSNTIKKEVNAFKDLPLDVFDHMVLPSGSSLSRNQQMLKYHLYLHQSHDSIMRVLNKIPSAGPYSILLQVFQKKMYLNTLRTAELNMNINDLDVFMITSMHQAVNRNAALNIDKLDSLRSYTESRKSVANAESYFREWIEHPLRHCIPHKLKVKEYTFQQWQECYDSLLQTLDDE